MPENGRVLPFRARENRSCTSGDSLEIARAYLAVPVEERTPELDNATLMNPDAFLAICSDLKSRCDSEPGSIFAAANRIYRWVEASTASLGLFDERDYFLGEVALTAGNAARQLGKRDEAECWFDRAEAGFRHTVNPAPLLANVAYARLALCYDRRQYQRVFEVLPSLSGSFRKLGMVREGLKCDFLAAMALKESSRTEEALGKLEAMRLDESLASEPSLEAFVLLHYGELLSTQGRYEEAVSCLKEVSSRRAVAEQPLIAAHLKSALGETFRRQGLLTPAADALRGAAEDYAAAGMAALEAYLRIVLAETLIALSRNREAEWQIAAALPTIEEQRMVPEGFAAVSLLRESVRRKHADSSALKAIREHLASKA